MRLLTFLLLSSLAATIWVSFVATMGYLLGQRGVDLVLLVDRYAIWVSFVLIFWLIFYSSWKAKREQAKQEAAGAAEESTEAAKETEGPTRLPS